MTSTLPMLCASALSALLVLKTTHILSSERRVSQTVPLFAPDTLLDTDRLRIVDAFSVAARYAERAWQGWNATAFPILLVTHDVEFLISPSRTPADTALRAPTGFTSRGWDPALRANVFSRSRVFPTGLLATFPLNSATPVVVIGRAEATGKSPGEWVMTLLHEHFHQLQFSQRGYYDSVKALDLARGDTTGMWALNYAFPYDSTHVQERFVTLTRTLVAALDTNTVAVRTANIAGVRDAFASLRSSLSAEDARYLDFQLWQEGAARYTEYRLASLAAADPNAASVYGRPWSTVRDSVFRSIVRATARADLARHRREVVYPVGAAIGLVLDAHDASWRDRYFSRPFALGFSGAQDSVR